LLVQLIKHPLHPTIDQQVIGVIYSIIFIIFHFRNLYIYQYALDIFYFSAFPVSLFHNLIPVSCTTGHGLPVLNEEGTLATPDIDRGSWVPDSSSSEVQFSHYIILSSPPLFNGQYFTPCLLRCD